MNRQSPLRRPFTYRFYNVTFVLIALNIVVFILGQFWKVRLSIGSIPGTDLYLALIPQLVLKEGYVWQIFTYMFVHDGYWHILFNMLVLFMFGVQLERRMGSSEFLLLYLVTGVGTGLVALAFGTNVVGASGALFGLLLAFATYFPDARVVIFFMFPVRAPIAVLVFTVLSLIFQFTGAFGRISHLGHLAGIVVAYLYFLVRLGINPIRQFLERR